MSLWLWVSTITPRRERTNITCDWACQCFRHLRLDCDCGSDAQRWEQKILISLVRVSYFSQSGLSVFWLVVWLAWMSGFEFLHRGSWWGSLPWISPLDSRTPSWAGGVYLVVKNKSPYRGLVRSPSRFLIRLLNGVLTVSCLTVIIESEIVVGFLSVDVSVPPSFVYNISSIVWLACLLAWPSCPPVCWQVRDSHLEQEECI